MCTPGSPKITARPLKRSSTSANRISTAGREVGVARRATVVFAALAAADTLLAATGHERLRWWTKPLLMPVLMAGRDRPAQRALALGGAGDVALLGSSQIAFTAGLVSFLAKWSGSSPCA